jgi:hypothetical protein
MPLRTNASFLAPSSEVGSWLRSLGSALAVYESTFNAYEIRSLSMAQQLTDLDLASMGITKLHRKRMRMDLAEMAEMSSTSQSYGLQAEFDAQAPSDSSSRTPRSKSHSRSRSRAAQNDSDSEYEDEDSENEKSEEEKHGDGADSSSGSDEDFENMNDDVSVASSVFFEGQGLPHVVNGMTIDRSLKQPVHITPRKATRKSPAKRPPLPSTPPPMLPPPRAPIFSQTQLSPSQTSSWPISYEDPEFERVCITVKCSHLVSATSRDANPIAAVFRRNSKGACQRALFLPPPKKLSARSCCFCHVSSSQALRWSCSRTQSGASTLPRPSLR